MYDKYKNINILYVEDDSSSLENLADAFNCIFNNVYTASNGEEGIRVFNTLSDEEQKNLIIVADLDLPEINGIEMLRIIRNIKSDVYSVILSAYSFKDYMFNINEMVMQNFFLTKPFYLKPFLELIDIIIEKMHKDINAKINSLLYQRYRYAIDKSTIVSKTNAKGKITYVNDEFCKLSGYEREELIGKHHNIVRHPDVSKEVFRNMWKTLRKKQIFKYKSLKNLTKDGSVYWVDTVIIPILNEQDKIIEYISIRHDTTPYQESIIRELNAKKSQEQFLTNMSHEIKTPLNSIEGLSNLLIESERLSESKKKECLKIINSNSKKLLNIINDVFEMSKIRNNELIFEETDFFAYLEINKIKKSFEKEATEKNIVLDLIFNWENKNCIENLVFLSDISKIKKILFNLIDNAIKFSPSYKKVDIIVQNLKLEDNIATVRFTVSDRGLGIDKMNQQVIFEPFKQLNMSSTKKYEGTGLGLSITKQLVDFLGGNLKLESEINEGSTFYFELDIPYRYN